MVREKLALLFITFGLLVAASMPMRVSAAGPFDVSANPQTDLGLQFPAASGLGSTDIRITIAKIVRVAMSLLGIIAVCIILFGGFTWMTAGGNDEKIGEAKKWIISGVVGLAIILSSFAIATFVITQLVNATTSGETTSGPLSL